MKLGRQAAFFLVTAFVLNAQILPKILKPKEEKPERTQVLELSKDPPPAVVADTRNLVFEVTPLAAGGLLTEQAEDALKWLVKRGRTVAHLRAFVAGTGDVRRVQAIVSETFSNRRLPLPSLTVLQAGSLGKEGAHVLFEAVAVEKRAVNPGGLAFVAGQGAEQEREAIARVRRVIGEAGAAPEDVLRLTCFLSVMDGAPELRRAALAEFPKAALAIVQRLRSPEDSGTVCEAVARLRAAPPGGLKTLPGAALVGPQPIALTGGQLAFGFEESDARLAFERLGRSLENVRASYDNVALARLYPLSRSIGEIARRAGAEFLNGQGVPAATVLPVEGLPSIDATFAIEVVAVLPGAR